MKRSSYPEQILAHLQQALVLAGMERANGEGTRWQCPSCRMRRVLSVNNGHTQPIVMHCFGEECSFDEIVWELNQLLVDKGYEALEVAALRFSDSEES